VDRDIIPILIIGGLILLGMRREAVAPPPKEEKPPIPQPPPYPPILGARAPPAPPRVVTPPQPPAPPRVVPQPPARVVTPPQPPPRVEHAREEWERVERALRQYGGYAVIFKTEPPGERITMFMNMLVNINVNTRGVCVYGGGYRWYDYLQAWVYDVKATWSPSEDMKRECKRLIRGAIESAFSGYYTKVREY
jgi:hypothetical protein